MATLGWPMEHETADEPESDSWRRRERERINERRRALEIRLAIVQEELRKVRAERELEGRSQRAASNVPVHTQSSSPPQGAGHASKTLHVGNGLQSGEKKGVRRECLVLEGSVRQISGSTAEIVDAEGPWVAVSATQVGREQPSIAAEVQMSPASVPCDNQDVVEPSKVDGARGDLEICTAPHDGELAGSSGAGAQCEHSLHAGAEAIRQVCSSDVVVQTATPKIAAVHEESVPQLTRADSGTATAGTGDDAEERLPDIRTLRNSGKDYIVDPSPSNEMPAQLVMRRGSRHDHSGPVCGTQIEGLATSANGPSELSALCVKRPPADRSACSVKTRGRRALTAGEGPEAERARNERKLVPARTAWADHMIVFGYTQQARVFDPGGRR